MKYYDAAIRVRGRKIAVSSHPWDSNEQWRHAVEQYLGPKKRPTLDEVLALPEVDEFLTLLDTPLPCSCASCVARTPFHPTRLLPESSGVRDVNQFSSGPHTPGACPCASCTLARTDAIVEAREWDRTHDVRSLTQLHAPEPPPVPNFSTRPLSPADLFPERVRVRLDSERRDARAFNDHVDRLIRKEKRRIAEIRSVIFFVCTVAITVICTALLAMH